MITSIPAHVKEKLGHYVYVYIDPRTDTVFYVGKGVGDRVLSHLNDAEDSEKVRRIRELRELKLEPKIEILKHGLGNNAEALLVESTAIDLLGLNALTNLVKGHGASENGRAALSDLIDDLDATEAKITDPVLLININRLYRYGMSPMELYDATRGVWVLDPNRAEKAKFAFAVYHGIVREVYEIATWLSAGSTHYHTRLADDVSDPTRYEFVGKVADENVRRKYRGKSVRHCLTKGSQNPIKYENC